MYAIAIGMDYKPGFNWWIPHILKKPDLIIALVEKCSTRYLKHTHEFGIDSLKQW